MTYGLSLSDFFFYFILINLEEENKECDLSECFNPLQKKGKKPQANKKKSLLFQTINSIFGVGKIFEPHRLLTCSRNSPVLIFTKAFELMQETNFFLISLTVWKSKGELF